MELSKATSVNSRAEELFVQLFCEAFGPEKRRTYRFNIPAWIFTVGTVTLILRWNLLNLRLQSK